MLWASERGVQYRRQNTMTIQWSQLVIRNTCEMPLTRLFNMGLIDPDVKLFYCVHAIRNVHIHDN